MLPPCTVCLLVFALGIGTETTVSAFRFKNPHTSTTRTHIRTEHIILREQPDLSPSLDNKEQGIIPWLPFIAAYGVMPSLFIALVDPNLSAIASSDAGFIAVLLSTRVHLYAMALVALDITSRKAQFSPATLFDRFILANEDLLGTSLSFSMTEAVQEAGLLPTVNTTTSELSQAVALPVVAGLALTTSYFITTLQSSLNAVTAATPVDSTVTDAFRVLLPLLPFAPIAAVCFLFLKSLLTQSKVISPKWTGVASAAVVVASFLGPPQITWPLQNIINLSIVAAVAQILQFPRLSTVLIALTGLTLYDVISVYATESNMSMMETVAKAKLNSGEQLQNLIKWQPGLFEVLSRGRVVGGLGLGDVIFPSILSGWAKRYDAATLSAEGSKTWLYASAMVGYGVGCVLCELSQSRVGIPALLFIVPSMAAFTLGSAALTGRVDSAFSAFKSDQLK